MEAIYVFEAVVPGEPSSWGLGMKTIDQEVFDSQYTPKTAPAGRINVLFYLLDHAGNETLRVRNVLLVVNTEGSKDLESRTALYESVRQHGEDIGLPLCHTH